LLKTGRYQNSQLHPEHRTTPVPLSPARPGSRRSSDTGADKSTPGVARTTVSFCRSSGRSGELLANRMRARRCMRPTRDGHRSADRLGREHQGLPSTKLAKAQILPEAPSRAADLGHIHSLHPHQVTYARFSLLATDNRSCSAARHKLPPRGHQLHHKWPNNGRRRASSCAECSQ